jgi:hypothetical protein
MKNLANPSLRGRPALRDFYSPLPDCGGTPWVIGLRLTSLHSERKATSGRGVHAYLHRKEGDQDNAAYWFRRAGQPFADNHWMRSGSLW